MNRPALQPWILLISILVAALLFALLVGMVLLTRPTRSIPGQATAVLTKIPAPSPTLPGTTPTSLFDLTPTVAVTSTPIPGTISVGAYVQIAGTGGDGLRLRIGPGLDQEPRFLGLESEVFQIMDGPIQNDEFTWWYLVAPFDESRNGWAVAPYLVVIENPN